MSEESFNLVPLGGFLGFIISTLLVYFILGYLGKVSDYWIICLVIILITSLGILIKEWFGEKTKFKIGGFFKEIKEGFKAYGDLIAIVINSILLTIVYVIGVGLTSIFAKIVGKDFLDMKIDNSKKTYWNELNIGEEDKDSHYRQF